MPWTVKQTDSNALVVKVPVVDQANWEQWFLLRSDVHWDNPDCDRGMEKRHLDEAVERQAGVIDCGDLFCAMQGKYDKRSDKSNVRPEHQRGDYLDALVRTAADYYEPYAHNLISLGLGNHETAIYGRHETCLTTRLVERLNDRTGSNVFRGGYSGFVRFQFERDQQRVSKTLWYIHGYGGGGPVTKDLIQLHRKMAAVDADIMVSGHTHDQWSVADRRTRMNASGRIVNDPILALKLGTYKDEFKTGEAGWHVQTGKPAKPVGAYWLRFWWDGRRGLRMQEVRAD